MNLCPHCKNEIHLLIVQPHGSIEAVLHSGEISLSFIIQVVAAEFGLPTRMIHSQSRERRCADARLAVYWFARKHTALSLSYIGFVVGRRDHGTVHKGSRRAHDLMATVPAYREHMERIAILLQAPSKAVTVLQSSVA